MLFLLFFLRKLLQFSDERLTFAAVLKHIQNVGLVAQLVLSWLEQQTHNLEVPGSSPGWSTLRIKHLREIASAFFFICVDNA